MDGALRHGDGSCAGKEDRATVDNRRDEMTSDGVKVGGKAILGGGEAWADVENIEDRAGSGDKGGADNAQIEDADDRGAVYRGQGVATIIIYQIGVINIIHHERIGAGETDKATARQA